MRKPKTHVSLFMRGVVAVGSTNHLFDSAQVHGTMISHASAQTLLGGGAPTQALSRYLLLQDDSGCPACEPARTAGVCVTSNTAVPPACALPSPWPAHDAFCAPAADRRASTRDRNGPRSVPLPPARCAETHCPAC